MSTPIPTGREAVEAAQDSSEAGGPAAAKGLHRGGLGQARAVHGAARAGPGL